MELGSFLSSVHVRALYFKVGGLDKELRVCIFVRLFKRGEIGLVIVSVLGCVGLGNECNVVTHLSGRICVCKCV